MRNVSLLHSSSMPNESGPDLGVTSRHGIRKPPPKTDAAAIDPRRHCRYNTSPSPRKDCDPACVRQYGGGILAIRNTGRQAGVPSDGFQDTITVFAPPAARMPMIWPLAPDGSLTNSDTLALGHAAPAAVSSASPRVRLPAASRLLSTPPVS